MGTVLGTVLAVPVTAQWHIGDVRRIAPTLPPGSVDLILGSPPFLALRSYLPDDHPDKAAELGAEPTPGQFIDALLDVVEACAPLLAPHGTLAIELGDTYAGSGGTGEGDGDRFDGAATRAFGTGQAPRPPRRRSEGPDPRYAQRGEQAQGSGAGGAWPGAKSLCLIPELFRVALVYGFNPLTGRTTPRWRARNVVRWTRPNPPVGALGDKFRPGTSEMVVVCHTRDRYFDLDAVRCPTDRGYNGGASERDRQGRGRKDGPADLPPNPAGAPPLDWWDPLPEEQAMWDQWADQLWRIPTRGYPGAHYATWPPALLIRPIKAMCPERVCATCGKPSRRIVDAQRTLDGEPADLPAVAVGGRNGRAAPGGNGVGHVRIGTARIERGWTDCGHGTWRPGVVLDPFGGSGTTASVALGLGRDSVSIDLDARNVDLAQDRLGMFPLDVTDHRTPAA